MDANVGLFSIASVNAISMLNPERDAFITDRVIDALAVVLEADNFFAIIHAISSIEPYDPQDIQCTIVLVRDIDAVSLANSVILKTGLKSHSLLWKRIDLKAKIDASGLIMNAAHCKIVDDDSDVIHLHCRPDTIQLHSSRDTISQLLEN